MPYVAPSTTADIDKKQRLTLIKLLHEKAVLGYAFSYAKLKQEFCKRLKLEEDEFLEILQDTVAAFNDADEKKVKEQVNDEISAIFSENGISSLRDTDPFGRGKDFIYFQSSSSSFNRDEAVRIAVSKFKIKAETMVAIMDMATTKKPFVTIQARDVKEKKEEGEK